MLWVCGSHLLGVWSLPLRVDCFLSETPLEKTKFSFARDYLLGIASGLGMGRKGPVFTSFSPGTPSSTDPCRPLCQSLWVHMCSSPIASRRAWFLGVLWLLFHSFHLLLGSGNFKNVSFGNSLGYLGVPMGLIWPRTRCNPLDVNHSWYWKLHFETGDVKLRFQPCPSFFW